MRCVRTYSLSLLHHTQQKGLSSAASGDGVEEQKMRAMMDHPYYKTFLDTSFSSPQTYTHTYENASAYKSCGNEGSRSFPRKGSGYARLGELLCRSASLVAYARLPFWSRILERKPPFSVALPRLSHVSPAFQLSDAPRARMIYGLE